MTWSLAGAYRELFRRSRLLAAVGAAHALLGVVLFGLTLVDGQTILGLNRWIKPMKFAFSIAIFTWTVAWFLGHLTRYPRAVRWLSGGMALSMLVEIVCIVMQPARGTTSHFNVATPLDGAVFALMGVMILLNTLYVSFVLMLFFTGPPALAGAYLWGIRLGLALFVLASLEGMVMVRNQAHTVGLPDGGPGLPILNWSTRAGDLRAAHFVGLHALQAVPLAGFLFSRARQTRPRFPAAAWTVCFAALYTAVGLYLYFQAMRGVPVWAAVPG